MHDYRQQKLQGRSFRGQNLTGADFSGADLRGVDFRDADLTGAKFVGAKAGITKLRQYWKITLGLLLGGFFGSLIFASLDVTTWFVDPIALIGPWETTRINRITVTSIYLLFHIASILAALNRQNWSVLWLCQAVLITILLAGAVLGAGELPDALMVSVAITAPTTVAATAAAAITAVAATAGALVVTVVITVAVIGAVTGAVALAAPAEMAGLGVGALMLLVFGFYLNWRCLKQEEPMLRELRHLNLAWQTWSGSDFRGATLAGTDFCQADLRYARFSGSPLVGCRWQQSKNLHLADTRNTLLEPHSVRRLLSNNDVGDKQFAYADLRGVVLAGIDLQGVNFHHADLSHADLNGCDLRDADLSKAMALGTNFSSTEFTGAILENWNVDKTTRFAGAQAKFVYLKRDKSEQSPPQGEFGDGDFAKLYQEVANIVDFIVHTPAELQALLCAIEAIKAQGGSIFIQQMERNKA